MGTEDACHLGDMVIFTVSVIIARFQAELPLAGTDGGRTGAVIAEGRGHRKGLHSGLSPESSFTYAERDDGVTRQEKHPHPSPLAQPLAKLLPVESFWQCVGTPAILRARSAPTLAAKHETFYINTVF